MPVHDDVEMVTREEADNPSSEDTAVTEGEDAPSLSNYLLSCMDASTLLDNPEKLAQCICMGLLVVALAAISTTAFTTCSKIKITNKTNDVLFFTRVTPYGAKVHRSTLLPHEATNASFGSFNDHLKLKTLDDGTLVARDNGECELLGGSKKRNFAPSSSSPIFWRCYCAYEKASPGKNNSVIRHLRAEEEDSSAEEMVSKAP